MAAPYEVRLDAGTAREFAERGGAILMLGVPAGTSVSIDHQSFTVGPRFCGVKMLPPGLHHVAYSAPATQGPAFAPTASFFFFAAGRGTAVRRWDPATELLLELRNSEEVERYEAGVRRFDFDAGMAPYDLASYGRWQALSSQITPEDVERLQPAGGAALCVTAEADPAVLRPQTAAEERLYSQLAHGAAEARRSDAAADADMVDAERPEADGSTAAAAGADVSASGRPHAGSPAADQLVGRSRFVPLPRLVKSAGFSPAQLTALNLDKSGLLERVIADSYGGREAGLLAEFQYAFVTFLLGQSLEGFAQWKDIMQLLLGCEDAPLRTRTALYVQFLAALRAQLRQSFGQASDSLQAAGTMAAGIGQFVEDLLPDSFLRHAFGGFFRGLDEADPGKVPKELASEVAALKQQLKSSLGLQFEVKDLDEEDDDGPVVVEM